jgi:mannose-6-phosphate isomerase-like protein (cupin superfamily)
MCWWFAEVPEGGIADDTYLSGCVSFGSAFLAVNVFLKSLYLLLPFFPSGTSEGGSYFHVKPHFHPKSDEHLMVSKGELHCEVDGKKYVVKEGDRFDIPRGIVHSVSFPAKTHTEFKVKGDHDPVAERDFLMQMMTLIQTVSVVEPCS